MSEIKKLKNKGGKKDESVMCSPCSSEIYKHVCKCENGICEKVEEELVEEVSIMTNKMEYERGETVEMKIKNDSDKELTFVLAIESFENGNWNKIVEDTRRDCGSRNFMLSELFVKANSEKIQFWNQKGGLCDKLPLEQKLRVGMIYRERNSDSNIIYSNEFTIKEKSALDPRCSDIKVVGELDYKHIVYMFNEKTGKCFKKVGGRYKIETPFKTLEECQEVCEEKEDVVFPNNNELIKCENNSDCVLVNSGCCSCSMGGGMTCINKIYLEDWNQVLRLNCKDNMDCPAVYLCDYNFTGCECVNNACQGTGGDFLDMVNEELLKSNQ